MYSDMYNELKEAFAFKTAEDKDIACPYCDDKKSIEDYEEYVTHAKLENMTPIEFIKANEGTYCKYTGLFMCTDHYIITGSRDKEDYIFRDYLIYRLDKKPLGHQDSNKITYLLYGL